MTTAAKAAPRLNLARARAALAGVGDQFAAWMSVDVRKLAAARERIRAEGLNPETVGALYMRVHDLKGLGGACEFPVVTRIAGSLCDLIDDERHDVESQMGLVDDHIDAIRILVEAGVRTEDQALAQRLLEDLDRDLAYR